MENWMNYTNMWKKELETYLHERVPQGESSSKIKENFFLELEPLKKKIIIKKS